MVVLLDWQGGALCDLAQVLHAAGEADEAAATLALALEPYEQKKNLTMSVQRSAGRAPGSSAALNVPVAPFRALVQHRRRDRAPLVRSNQVR